MSLSKLNLGLLISFYEMIFILVFFFSHYVAAPAVCEEDKMDFGNCHIRTHYCGTVKNFKWKYMCQAFQDDVGANGEVGYDHASNNGACKAAVWNMLTQHQVCQAHRCCNCHSQSTTVGNRTIDLIICAIFKTDDDMKPFNAQMVAINTETREQGDPWCCSNENNLKDGERQAVINLAKKYPGSLCGSKTYPLSVFNTSLIISGCFAEFDESGEVRLWFVAKDSKTGLRGDPLIGSSNPSEFPRNGREAVLNLLKKESLCQSIEFAISPLNTSISITGCVVDVVVESAKLRISYIAVNLGTGIRGDSFLAQGTEELDVVAGGRGALLSLSQRSPLCSWKNVFISILNRTFNITTCFFNVSDSRQLILEFRAQDLRTRKTGKHYIGTGDDPRSVEEGGKQAILLLSTQQPLCVVEGKLIVKNQVDVAVCLKSFEPKSLDPLFEVTVTHRQTGESSSDCCYPESRLTAAEYRVVVDLAAKHPLCSQESHAQGCCHVTIDLCVKRADDTTLFVSLFGEDTTSGVNATFCCFSINDTEEIQIRAKQLYEDILAIQRKGVRSCWLQCYPTFIALLLFFVLLCCFCGFYFLKKRKAQRQRLQSPVALDVVPLIGDNEQDDDDKQA